MFICADHGNAEYMIDEETKEPFTAHTTNPVPFILVNADPAYKLKEDGCLADIAPTLIELMGMEQPAEMTGTSLLCEIIQTYSTYVICYNEQIVENAKAYFLQSVLYLSV